MKYYPSEAIETHCEAHIKKYFNKLCNLFIRQSLQELIVGSSLLHNHITAAQLLQRHYSESSEITDIGHHETEWEQWKTLKKNNHAFTTQTTKEQK